MKNFSDAEKYDFEELDKAAFKPGAHRHGYVISLTEKEEHYLRYKGYTLVTNMFYKKGDFFEVSLDGRIIDPIELGKILKEGGF